MFFSPQRMLFHNVGCSLNWTMVRECYIHTWVENAVSLSVPQPKAVSVVGSAGSSLSAYLGLHLRGKRSHFGRTVITRATDLNWNRLPCQPPQLMSSTTFGWIQRWGTFSVSYSEKWECESERWSKASKGRCNWADLDRLPGNIKQQQLWRRVIASWACVMPCRVFKLEQTAGSPYVSW